MRNIIAILCCLLAATGSVCTQNLTAPLLSGSWQSTYHNPAMVHFLPSSFTIGLPGLTNDLRLENLSYNDLFVTEGGQRFLTLNDLPNLLGDRNEIRNSFSVETFGLAFKKDRWGMSAYHRLRVYGEADYPRTLVDVLARGNAPFIGQTIEIAPIGSVTSYHEFGASLSYAITDEIAIGGRLKYLSGVADLRTSTDASLRLTTGEENYTLTLDQNLTLNTAGIIDYNGLDSIDVNYDLNRLRVGDFFNSSSGVALDFGITVNLDKLRLQASATDIGGKINWSEDVTSLKLEGIREFSGLDILEQLLEDSISFESALDSLSDSFEPVESNNSYRGNIDAAYYFGAEYQVSDRFSTGVLVVLNDRFLGIDPAFAVMGRYTVVDWLHVGVNYNYRKAGGHNVGIHLFADPGPVQFFASTDKLLSLLKQKDSSRSGVRIGAALSLGDWGRSSSSFRP